MNIPRVLVAGLSGGSGKTLISLGLLAAWRNQGRRVSSFKKGPDYIDAAWLSLAAGHPCRNLDLYLMTPPSALHSFVTTAAGSDAAIIEGNRGLFDGMDAQGSYSSAELAKLLDTAVILCVDCTKATRTVAAAVLGCQKLDPMVRIEGVVLNRVGGPRHASVLREAVESVCGIPVLGAIPRLPDQIFPERHLGLVPPQEHGRLASAIEGAASVAEEHIDVDAIWKLAIRAGELEPLTVSSSRPDQTVADVRIGIFRDAAFQFYYPDNLEALTRLGARLTEISPIKDTVLPEVDALYIGGGFPETLAPALSKNKTFLASLRHSVEQGLPVYAECGGTVYLGEKLCFEGNEYGMAAALPAVFAFQARPQGHGYTTLETVNENPFYSVGETLRGHEFHYTYLQSPVKDLRFAFRVHRGHGFDGDRDGLCYKNVLACYTHVHALGSESWAPSLVRAAAGFSKTARNPHRVARKAV